MDGFIDKLADLLRTLLGDGGSASRRQAAGDGADDAFRGRSYVDPDLRDAWDELDDYMKGGTGERTRRTEEHQSRARRSSPDESLRRDYANLEVPFGSDIETVRSSYKSLMLKYHPDKYAANPEKQKVALEITKKINESFERIRARHGSA
jgi:hypothetical protein